MTRDGMTRRERVLRDRADRAEAEARALRVVAEAAEAFKHEWNALPLGTIGDDAWRALAPCIITLFQSLATLSSTPASEEPTMCDEPLHTEVGAFLCDKERGHDGYHRMSLRPAPPASEGSK